MEQRICAGYVITQSIQVKDTEFVPVTSLLRASKSKTPSLYWVSIPKPECAQHGSARTVTTTSGDITAPTSMML